MTDYKKEYIRWKEDSFFDEETRREISEIKDEKEIEDRFYKSLSFGTGGLRGVIGAGTNRMNFYTVGKATQGLANFINSETKNGSVAIAYDSRNMSPEFALDTALIFAANGIKAYLFDELRPTPELSFAVRYLKTTAGVVITASHNPPQYNGYKVYWSDGAQVVAPYDKLIIDEVNKIDDYSSIKKTDKESAIKSGMLKIIGKEIDDAYIAQIKKSVLNEDVIKRQSNNIKIVYTPLNGTGRMPVTRVLKELGFNNVYVVKEQEMPDENFPTLKFPNPEDPKAFTYAINLAKKVNADIVMATDPDADRLGIYCRDKDGEYKSFTGNMSGLLIAEYELSERAKRGLLSENSAIVTTIVSSNMTRAMAKNYGIKLFEVLTGFKYIGEQIKLFEEAKAKNGGNFCAEKYAYDYIFGYEESYGCLVGTHARDKDAVMAVTALSEAAAFYKEQGLSLIDQMENIYQKYGYYKESLATKVLEGASGAEKINEIMNKLRNEKIDCIGGEKVVSVADYSVGIKTYIRDGKTDKVDLPKSNVLYYELENDGWCCIRPSGTEPKIKFYIGVKGENSADSDRKLKLVEEGLFQITE